MMIIIIYKQKHRKRTVFGAPEAARDTRGPRRLSRGHRRLPDNNSIVAMFRCTEGSRTEIRRAADTSESNRIQPCGLLGKSLHESCTLLYYVDFSTILHFYYIKSHAHVQLFPVKTND